MRVSMIVIARYYDPTTAQFLSVDPDVATTLSPYGYVAGDPLNAGDPSGLCGWAPWDWLSCVDSNSIQSQNELAHPTAGQEGQNLLNLAAILNMEDGAGEAIEGCELATEGTASEAFAYTSDENVSSIMENGLKPNSFATPNGELTPLQAKLELALPQDNEATSVVRIDIAGMQDAGYDIPEVTRVTGQFSRPGGGYEMQFPYGVPTEFLRVGGG